MQSPRVRNRNRAPATSFATTRWTKNRPSCWTRTTSPVAIWLQSWRSIFEDIMRPQRGQHAGPEHLQMKVVPLAQNFRHETTFFRAVSPRFRIHEEPITNSYGETDSVSASRRFFRTRAPWFQTPARTGMTAFGKASCRSAACQPLAFHRSSLPFGSCIPTLHRTRISR